MKFCAQNIGEILLGIVIVRKLIRIRALAEPVELWEHPPNGQGLVALMALGMFEELEKAGKIKTFLQKNHNSPE